MNIKFPLLAAMFAVATLSACGGSSDTASAPVYNPPALVKTDTVTGTGAEAVANKVTKVHYTAYLYNTEVANFKGRLVDTTAGGDPYTYTVGVTNVIEGFKQGVTGMKAGGKRTVIVPASLAYGAGGSRAVPPNSGMVFDLELVQVQ